MKKSLALLGMLILLTGALCACGKASATVLVKDVFTNTMEYIPDPEEGEEAPEAPEPVFVETELTKSTELICDLKVSFIGEDKITFRYDENFLGVRVYSTGDASFGTFLRDGAHGTVTLNRGEELVVDEIGLLDASHTVTIRLK